MKRVGRVLALILLLAISLWATGAWAQDDAPPEATPAEEAPVVEPSPEPSPEPSSSPTPSPSPSPTPEATPEFASAEEPPASTASAGEEPEGTPAGDLTVSATTAELLVQVGDELHYTVTVSNPSDAPLTGVVVVDLVPGEVDVLGVPLNDAVEAIEFGHRGGMEDIVWVVGDLAAGESLDLEWIGTAAKAGDLTARNRVSAAADEITEVRAEHASYLGAVEGQSTDNSAYEPIRRKVVTYTRPVVTKVLAAPPASGVLPITGVGIAVWLWSAAGLIGAGIVVLVFARQRARALVIVVAAIAMLGTACVSEEPSADSQGSGTTQPAPDENTAPTDEPPEDRVLGTRVTRDGDDDADQETETTEPDTQIVEVLGDPVAQVEFVELSASELPTDDVPSMPAENTMTYEWDEGSSSILAAHSSRFVTDSSLELVTSLNDADGDIDIVATLRNLSEDRTATVKGRLVHTVFGSSGEIARFVSDPIDVSLAPGGETSATFTYVLPSGEYTAEAAFEAR